MRYLFLLFLLSIPLAGWAGEPDGSSMSMWTYDGNQWKRTTITNASPEVVAMGREIIAQSNCLTQMRAAMEAMEPFLSPTYRLLRQTLDNEDPKFVSAKKLWEQAKGCGRTP